MMDLKVDTVLAAARALIAETETATAEDAAVDPDL
jgi:hypothetical protein